MRLNNNAAENSQQPKSQMYQWYSDGRATVAVALNRNYVRRLLKGKNFS
jgi:hypothetical protein